MTTTMTIVIMMVMKMVIKNGLQRVFSHLGLLADWLIKRHLQKSVESVNQLFILSFFFLLPLFLSLSPLSHSICSRSNLVFSSRQHDTYTLPTYNCPNLTIFQILPFFVPKKNLPAPVRRYVSNNTKSMDWYFMVWFGRYGKIWYGNPIVSFSKTTHERGK